MFVTAHSAIGIAAVTAIGTQNPAAAFAVGWLLHYVADAIPHGDERLGAWCMSGRRPTWRMGGVFTLDLLVFSMVLAVAHLTHGLTWVVVAAAVGSMMPDLLLGFEMVLQRRTLSWLTRIHNAAHKSTGLIFSLKYGLPAQVMLAVLMWSITLR